MASSQRFRALPDVQSIKDPATRSAYEAIKEDLEVLLGLSGDSNLAYVSKGSLGGTPTEPEEPQEYVPGTGEPPILPIPVITEEDIHAAGFYDWIMLSWDISYDYWLAHFEIFRAMVNDLTQAIPVGTTLDHVWIDRDVSPGQDYYYWIRIVQKTSAGGNIGDLPTDGKLARCLDDPTWIINQLVGKITESHLYQSLADRIDLIDGDGPLSVNARIATEAAERAQAILNESLAREASDNAMLQQIEDVDTATGALASQIGILDSQVTILEDVVSSHSSAISVLQATVNDPDSGVVASAQGLSALEGRVTENESDILANAQQITYLAALIDDLSGGGQFGAEAFMALEARVTAAEGEIDSISSQIVSLGSDLSTAEGSIAANANAISSLETRTTTLEGTASSHSSRILTLENDVTVLDGEVSGYSDAISSIESRVTAAEGAISAQSSSLVALEARVTDAELELAGISGDVNAWAAAISAMQTTVEQHGTQITSIADQTTQLSTTVGEHTTSIEQHALSIDGIEGEYTIKIDANGKVAGIGLINGPTGSEFAIRANKFYIVYPEGDGSVSIVPFVVGMVNGTSTVGINGALIVDGTILARMIAAGAVTADKISVSNLAAISANLGSITAGSINIGSGVFRVYSTGQAYFGNCDLQSSNYQAGVSGWRLTRAGQLYITNLQCVAADNIQNGAVTRDKIGDRQVTNIKIGEAAVSTFTISGQAVTVPVYAYSNANHVFYSRGTWMTTIGAILDPQSQPVLVMASCFFSVGATGSAASRSIYVGYRVRNVTRGVTLKEEANMLYVPPSWTGVYFQPTCYAHDTAPASGNNSYSLDVLIDDGTWLVNTSGSSLVSRRHISCVGYKR